MSVSIEYLCGLPEKDAPMYRSHGSMPKHSPARDAVHTALKTQARKTAPRAIKERARDYIALPCQLDLLRNGYDASIFTASQLISFAKDVLLDEIAINHRWLGLGGEVQIINAKAAIVAGRFRRAREAHNARVIS